MYLYNFELVFLRFGFGFLGLNFNPTNQLGRRNDGDKRGGNDQPTTGTTTGETTVNGQQGIWLTNYGLPKKMVKNCKVGSAYTYKVQEGAIKK